MDNREVKPDFCNEAYQHENFFRYPTWLYVPYVSSLITCGLEKGASILDVGCGQGFFSYLLCKCGMRVHGIDISEAGIRADQSLCGRFGATFSVADARFVTFPEKFDCVIVRSCSLSNNPEFM